MTADARGCLLVVVLCVMSGTIVAVVAFAFVELVRALA